MITKLHSISVRDNVFYINFIVIFKYENSMYDYILNLL